MTATFECEFLHPGNLSGLCAALESEGMPAADLFTAQAAFFRFQSQDNTLGFVGLEGSGTDLLLRSMWIAPGLRDQGIGHRVVEWIEAHARDRGAQTLHLLTTTAERFFVREGYVCAVRALAPASISACREFQSLCPASASYLSKTLRCTA